MPENALQVEVLAQQWHWSYRLPGEDGEFGNVSAKLITNENPFGMDYDDPVGQDDILISSPELHLPVNVPVNLNLRAKDVLHNFTVAEFRVKMDMVPGMVTSMWFTPTKTGRYDLLCEELCGIAHHAMRGAVIVDEADDYENWVASHPTLNETQIRMAYNPEPSAAASQYAVCAACHGQQGEGMVVLNAPKISGQSEWYLRKQLENYKDGVRGTHKDDLYGQQMAPMSMTLFNEQAMDNVIAHIQSFPDNPAPKTITGDIEKGKETYIVCAYCHGQQGEGIKAMNAPRMAGMTDWYLERQLQNFKKGIRGQHPEDYYGKQMGFMARILQDDKKIRDLVAYMNTL